MMVGSEEIPICKEYSRNLFRNQEGGPLEFYVCPSIDSDHIIQLIKNGGGEIVSDEKQKAIHIVSGKGIIEKDVCVSPSFIYASCLENKLLDINYFRIQPETLPASSFFEKFLEILDNMNKKISDERIAKIISNISRKDDLWEALSRSWEFEGCSKTEIRGAFNIWAFLSLRVMKTRHNNIIKDLVSAIKSLAEEYSGCGNDIKENEKLQKSEQMTRKSTEPNDDVSKGRIYRLIHENHPFKQRLDHTQDASISSCVASGVKNCEKLSLDRVGESNAVLDTSDKNYDVNRVESQTNDNDCVDKIVDREYEREDEENMADLIDEGSNISIPEKCTDERVKQGQGTDSEGVVVNESDGIAENQKSSENEIKGSTSVVKMVASTSEASETVKTVLVPLRKKKFHVNNEVAKSGVWLDKVSAKKGLCSEKEIISIDEDSSDNSDAECSSPEIEKVQSVVKRFQPNKMYTVREDLTILKWVLRGRRKYPWKWQGNNLWMYFEKKKILPNRSWQSMKERFKRHISSQLDKYNLTQEEIRKLRKLL